MEENIIKLEDMPLTQLVEELSYEYNRGTINSVVFINTRVYIKEAYGLTLKEIYKDFPEYFI